MLIIGWPDVKSEQVYSVPSRACLSANSVGIVGMIATLQLSSFVAGW